MRTSSRPTPGPFHRPGVVAALIILPALLASLQLLSMQTQLKFLLFPPLASLGYRIFRTPHTVAARARSVIVAPTLGSVCGAALSAWGGLTALTTALAVTGGILIVEALAADAPPTLAVTVLALFLTGPDWTYPLSVLTATTSLYMIFLGWRWLSNGRLRRVTADRDQR